MALIEEAADKMTDGNKTEATTLAVRCVLDETARAGSLLARIAGQCGFTKESTSSPALDVEPDAEIRREIERGPIPCWSTPHIVHRAVIRQQGRAPANLDAGLD